MKYLVFQLISITILNCVNPSSTGDEENSTQEYPVYFPMAVDCDKCTGVVHVKILKQYSEGASNYVSHKSKTVPVGNRGSSNGTECTIILLTGNYAVERHFDANSNNILDQGDAYADREYFKVGESEIFAGNITVGNGVNDWNHVH